MKNLIELVQDLEYAKKSTQATLNNANCSVDMKGLSYWAKRVEDLREEVKKIL